MAKFGLDWVKFKTQRCQLALLCRRQWSLWFLSLPVTLLCHCGIKAEPPNKKMQQLTLHSIVLCAPCTAYFSYNNKPRKVFFHCEAFPKSDLRRGNSCDWIENQVSISRTKAEDGQGHAAEPLEVQQKSSGTGINLSGAASPPGPTADKALLGKSLCVCRLLVSILWWQICCNHILEAIGSGKSFIGAVLGSLSFPCYLFFCYYFYVRSRIFLM